MNILKNRVGMYPGKNRCRAASEKRSFATMRAFALTGIVAFTFGSPYPAQAATVSQIANIYSGIPYMGEFYTEQELGEPLSSNPAGFARFRNELVFSANDGTTGNEIWKVVQPAVK
jgi:hypothetical protein